MPLYIPTGTLSGTQTVSELNATSALKLNGEAFPEPSKIPILDETPVFTVGLKSGEDPNNVYITTSTISITSNTNTLQITSNSIDNSAEPLTASDSNGNLLWIRSTAPGNSISIGAESIATIDVTLSDGSVMTVVNGVK